jgi:hypothetical protein
VRRHHEHLHHWPGQGLLSARDDVHAAGNVPHRLEEISMEDTLFDELARTFGAAPTRRLMVGTLLGGALARLGLGAVNAKQGKRENTNGRDGQPRTGEATGRGARAAATAQSSRCTPGCGVCQQCKPGKCRKTGSGKRKCKKGTCTLLTGTTCTLATGGAGICQAGTCVLPCPGGATDCSGVCKNLQTDPANCGQCGKVCAAQQVCVASGCCFPNGTPGVCTADNFTDVCCPGPTGQQGCQISTRGAIGTCIAL